MALTHAQAVFVPAYELAVRFERGNSRAYILARLDRDGHAELAAKVRAGKLSANAAAIAAGFRKKPIRRCPQCGHQW